MAPVRDNTKFYPTPPFDRTNTRLSTEIFVVEVMSVDFERRVLTVQDVKDNLLYRDITIFPAANASLEGNEQYMPEPGSIGLACNFAYANGYRIVMILSWIQSQLYISVDTIANRVLSGDKVQGYSDRYRGSYRKAYPGQKTASYTGGFTEKIDTAWDRQGNDYSRDKNDSDRRQWTQIAGRRVQYSDAGVAYQGSVSRPGAKQLVPVILPDGTSDYIVYLQPGAQPSDRYISGKPDVIPFSEHTELVQEFSLDYPVPYEVLQTSLLDTILGTTASAWGSTTVTSPSGQVAFDSESFMITQQWDDPYDDRVQAVGPTLKEGTTPQRRGYILEKAQGTLVGYSLFDTTTYGFVLKPQLFVSPTTQTRLGRFGSDVESAYVPVVDGPYHAEARLAASCLAIRFPYEQNTTRLDVTKEGFTSLEIGSTLPKENIQKFWTTSNYEHPHGAGRSLEAHLVGSAKLVIGKNRDEEDALDAAILGQTVLRLGADDTSQPNAARTAASGSGSACATGTNPTPTSVTGTGRIVQTQIRSQNDKLAPRTLQYWTPTSTLGDAGCLTNKTGMENISLRGAFDGGTVLRLGGRDPHSKRRHLMNGYMDGPGKQQWGVNDTNRVDSKSPGRPDYGAGDSVYAFSHPANTVSPSTGSDLTTVGAPINTYAPYAWSGPAVVSTTNPSSPLDSHGLSLDVHAVRDIMLRVGANPDSGQSLLMDLAGGIVAALGLDNQGRSITAALDGGIEITIRPNKQGKAIRLNIIGDIDVTHQGNLHYHSTGDWITENTTWRHVTKTDRVFSSQKSVDSTLSQATHESPEIVHNQGGYAGTNPQVTPNTAAAATSTPPPAMPSTPGSTSHNSDHSLTGAEITNDPSTWPTGDCNWNIAHAIAMAEGYNVGTGTAPYDLNNPGDISDYASEYGSQYHGGSNITTFPTAEAGWTALHGKVAAMVNGTSTVYSNKTWAQVAQTYAGNSSAWLNNVTKQLGVDPNSYPKDYKC
jgi:hypothetical protein